MKQYLDLLQDVLANGHVKADRTGTGTLSVFGRMMHFDLKKGFPLVTTKQIHLRSLIHELLWFLNGDTNTKYLNENGVSFWDEWADENGDLGPVYGHQWRAWRDVKVVPTKRGNAIQLAERGYRDMGTINQDNAGPVNSVFYKEHDQISKALEMLRTDPNSRRIIVSAWNVSDLEDQALNPCHSFFQFYTRKLTNSERRDIALTSSSREDILDARPILSGLDGIGPDIDISITDEVLTQLGIPERALSCMFYMRKQDCAFVA